MTDQSTHTPQAPQTPPLPAQIPDALDTLAVQLVGMDHQLRALSALVHGGLLAVQALLAARGQPTPTPSDPSASQSFLTRMAAGFPGDTPAPVGGVPTAVPRNADGSPRTFMQRKASPDPAASPASPTDSTIPMRTQ